MSRSRKFILRNASDVAVAVSASRTLAGTLGFGPTVSYQIGTAVSELATNVIRYAGEGTAEFRVIRLPDRDGFEAVFLDEGPGIPDIAVAMRDHVSSRDSLGLGLPSVRRLMDEFVLESEVGVGTRARICKWVEANEIPVGYALHIRPRPGEAVSGDAALILDDDRHVLLASVDGVGHGRGANDVARSVTRLIKEHPHDDLSTLMMRVDQKLRGGRGVSLGLARFDRRSAVLSYVGIGDTIIRKFGDKPERLVSRDGVVGGDMPTPRVLTMHLDPGDVVVMHTDGVRNRFALSSYPHLLRDSANTIARAIVRLFGKSHDDASCIVLRYGAN